MPPSLGDDSGALSRHNILGDRQRFISPPPSSIHYAAGIDLMRCLGALSASSAEGESSDD